MSQNPSQLQALFAELKRRRVFRVMAMYGVVAFIVLQIADLVFPILELPDWTLQFVLMLTLLGFPIAIVIAWAFDATDEGIRRAVPASPELIQEIVALPASKRWPAGLLALLGVGLLFGGGWWMGNRSLGDGEANIIVPSAQASDFKAIGALPFENVNGDEENRLIAIGVHEDLLAQMQRISALRVTSGTSVREYQDTDKTFEQIAGELGVEYLLEGSVRRAGDEVRVRVSLVDASSAEQVWAQVYDREVTPDNLFQLTSDIARSVVSELEAELTPQDVATLDAMAPGSDLAAQTRYHRAVELYTTNTVNAEEARDELLAAVEIDPGFVAAWSRLAHMQSWLAQSGLADDADARAARDRTVELAPGTVEAHLAVGYYAYYAQLDFDAALASFQEAEVLAPSNADVVWSVGLILRRQGEWDASTEKMKRAIQLDPRDPQKLLSLRENLTNIGAHEDADAVAERLLSIAPGESSSRLTKVTTLAVRDGDFDRARRLASELGFRAEDPGEGIWLAFFAFLDGDDDRALAIMDEIDVTASPFAEVGAQAVRTNFLTVMDGKEDERASAGDSLLVLLDAVEWPEQNESQMRLSAYAALERWDDLRAEIAQAEVAIRRGEDAMQDRGWAESVAIAYGRLGDLDSGFEWLEELADTPGGPGLNMTLPWFAPYHDDPRFEEVWAQYEAFVEEGQRKAEAMRPFLP